MIMNVYSIVPTFLEVTSHGSTIGKGDSYGDLDDLGPENGGP